MTENSNLSEPNAPALAVQEEKQEAITGIPEPMIPNGGKTTPSKKRGRPTEWRVITTSVRTTKWRKLKLYSVNQETSIKDLLDQAIDWILSREKPG